MRRRIARKIKGKLSGKIPKKRLSMKRIRRVKEVMKRSRIFNLSRLKLRRFKPHVTMWIEKNNFVIKTVENRIELRRALKLRHDVFYEELLDKKRVMHMDLDKFDFICDHIVIIDTRIDRYIGTYRLNSSLFSGIFYSEQEFDIENILRHPGAKLELGRACVDKDYRGGISLALLWRGIAEYLKKIDARYLFGCSSVKTTDMREISLLYRYLRKNFAAPDDYRVRPVGKFRIKELDEIAGNMSASDKEEEAAAKALIPPLLDFYLKAGAKICGEPALDRSFECVDFFTILDLENIKKSFGAKYKM